VDERVLDHLSVGRHVAFIPAIEIRTPHLQRIQPQGAGDLIEYLLDHHHALWSAEAAEGGIRHGVGLAAVRDDLHMLEKIGVVHVHERPVVDRSGQIG
jgi:hypothetical protein